MKACSVEKQVHVLACFGGKNRCWVLYVKDAKDHPGCYQQQVWNPASVMVWVHQHPQQGRFTSRLQENRGEQEHFKKTHAVIKVSWYQTASGLILDVLRQNGCIDPEGRVRCTMKRRIRKTRWPQTVKQQNFFILYVTLKYILKTKTFLYKIWFGSSIYIHYEFQNVTTRKHSNTFFILHPIDGATLSTQKCNLLKIANNIVDSQL